MPLNPTEWIKFTLSVFGRTSLLIWGALFISTAVSAAVLRLNPGDNPNNVITFEGAFEATVVQSAAGMDIVIPGVDFTLNCQGDPTDSCTVSVGATPVEPAPPPAPSPPTPSTPSEDPPPSDDGDCDDNTSFGGDTCSNGGPTGSTTSPTEPATDEPTENDPNSGFDVPTSNEEKDPASDGGWGLNAPADGSDPGGELTREAFPGSSRADYQSTPDFGSGGAQSAGNTYPIILGLKTVTVLPFKMSSDPANGGLGFYPSTTTPSGGDLVFWISTSQDGDAVSGACKHKGGFDGKLSISTQESAGACLLQAGTQYFLNVATCYSGDYACRNGAKTAYEAGKILMAGVW